MVRDDSFAPQARSCPTEISPRRRLSNFSKHRSLSESQDPPLKGVALLTHDENIVGASSTDSIRKKLCALLSAFTFVVVEVPNFKTFKIFF